MKSIFMALVVALVAGSAGCGPSGVAFAPGAGVWGQADVPAWTAQRRLATTNSRSDTVSFVTVDAQPALLGEFKVGNIPVELEGPHHMVASPDGEFLYVGLSNYVPGSGSGPHGAHGVGTVPGSLLKLRASDGAEVAEADVDRNPGDVILSADGRTAFVSHYDLLRLQNQQMKGLPESAGYSSVAVIDTATMNRPPLYPVCATAHGMLLSQDEKTLYVACGQTDELGILDLTTHEAKRVRVGPMQRPPLDPAYFPYALARSPRDGSIWISCNNTGDLRVYDPAKGAMDPARTVFVNGVPLFGDFLPDGTTLLVPHQGDDRVSYIDTAQSKEITAVALPPDACLNAHAVRVMPDGMSAFVVCEGDHATRPGTIVALDVPARAVTGFVKVGLFPDSVLALPPVPR